MSWPLSLSSRSSDRALGFLFALAAVGGIPLALAGPTCAFLYVFMFFSAPFAIRGWHFICRVLGERPRIDYRWALLGLIPVAFSPLTASWGDVLGAIALVVVAIAEEFFRAGAAVLTHYLMEDVGLRGRPFAVLSLIVANLLWIAYHGVHRDLTGGYVLFLVVCATVFSLALVKGGLGAACLAHILTNALASWVVLSTYLPSETGEVFVSGLLIVVVVAVVMYAVARGRA